MPLKTTTHTPAPMKAFIVSGLTLFSLFCSFRSMGQCSDPLTINGSGGVTTVCPGGSLQLELIGTPAGSTQIWRKDSENGPIVQNCNCSAITINQPGTYYAANQCNGSTSAYRSITITQPPSGCGGGCSTQPPTITGGGTVCSGQTVQLTASNCSGTITWNNGLTGSPINVGVGTYTATCTANGCTSGNSSSITVNSGSNCGGGGGVNANALGQFVGINTTNNGSQNFANFGNGYFNLAVNGRIIANEIRVRNTWADFVFDPAYRLRPLSSVERYIKANRHLPDVITEAEVQASGVSLGEANAMLLRKIEELTLYLIQQEKRLRRLEGIRRRKK